MRYLVRARVKTGREQPLLRAIETGTLAGGSVAEGEYLRNMIDARNRLLKMDILGGGGTGESSPAFEGRDGPASPRFRRLPLIKYRETLEGRYSMVNLRWKIRGESMICPACNGEGQFSRFNDEDRVLLRDSKDWANVLAGGDSERCHLCDGKGWLPFTTVQANWIRRNQVLNRIEGALVALLGISVLLSLIWFGPVTAAVVLVVALVAGATLGYVCKVIRHVALDPDVRIWLSTPLGRKAREWSEP